MSFVGRTRLATAVAIQLASCAIRAADAAAPATSAAEVPIADDSLEEIIVTGSRIQQRLEDAPVPVIVIDRDDIERASQDAIGKVLQQIPINTGFAQNTNVNNGGDGSTRLNLRGLGSERTLVLVNGRRFVYGGNGGNTSVDVNMIPMSLVERVEVVGVGSSTVYGSDAIGGVVNLITRDDYDGAEISGSYTTSDHQDGSVYDLQFVAGQTGDKGYVTFGAELVDQHAVFQSARAYSRHTEYLNDSGGVSYRGSPATPDGQFRVPDNNALGLPGGVYTRVHGSGNPPTAADFRTFNFNATPEHPTDLYDYAPINYLQTPNKREYLWAVAGYDVNDYLSFFADALVHHRDSEQQLAPTPLNSGDPAGGAPELADGSYGIPADNYYNPFGIDLGAPDGRVRRRFVESVGRQFNENVQTQWYVAGLRGRVGDTTWNWELSADYGRNDTEVTTDGEFRADHLRLALGHSGPDASGHIVCGQRDPATGMVPADQVIAGCVPLNVFGGAGTITGEMLDYVTATLTDRGYNEQQAYELIFRGDWGTLPGGDVRWATGATHRVESAAVKVDKSKLAGVAGNIDLNLTDGGAFTANEAYVEAVAPLLKDRTAAEDLNLTAGLRYSDFSSFGTVTTYQGGLLYRPVHALTLRTSYGTVFRAPPIAALYEADATSEAGFYDPCGDSPTPEVAANCAAAGVPGGSYVQPENDSFLGVSGGNRDLQPETGHSVSGGFTYAPTAVNGLQLSVDYWLTKLDDVIVLDPQAQDYANACAYDGAKAACSHITRNSDGSVNTVDLRHTNAASLTASGYDFDLGYVAPLAGGNLSTRASATYMIEDDYQPVQGAGSYNAVGWDAPFGAMPRLRGLGYVEYARAGWSIAYQAQYIGHMKENIYPDTLPPDQYVGWHEIDARWYQDVRFQYSLEKGPTLALAINNLAGENPPRVVYSNGANTDMAAYPLLGRTYYAQLSYKIE
jgi:iron complex outermembrane recepter protein